MQLYMYDIFSFVMFPVGIIVAILMHLMLLHIYIYKAVMYLVLLLRFVWVCVWCISSHVCIVAVLSVCISDEPSVCCVCGYI